MDNSERSHHDRETTSPFVASERSELRSRKVGRLLLCPGYSDNESITHESGAAAELRNQAPLSNLGSVPTRATGLGHCARIAAVAELFDDSPVRAVLLLPERAIPNIKHLFRSDLEIVAIPSAFSHSQTAEFIGNYLSPGSDGVLLDGYQFDLSFQRQVRAARPKMLAAFDDLVLKEFDVDYVINAAGYAIANPPRIHRGQLLTGFSYLCVRAPFSEARSQLCDLNPGALFLSFGSVDSQGICPWLLSQQFLADRFHTVHVVSSSASPHYRELLDWAQGTRNTVAPMTVHVLAEASASEIANAMRNSSLAIVSSSTVGLEAAVVGLPIVTGFWVENQRAIYHALVSEGYAVGVGSLSEARAEDWIAAIDRALSHVKSSLSTNLSSGHRCDSRETHGVFLSRFKERPGSILRDVLVRSMTA